MAVLKKIKNLLNTVDVLSCIYTYEAWNDAFLKHTGTVKNDDEDIRNLSERVRKIEKRMGNVKGKIRFIVYDEEFIRWRAENKKGNDEETQKAYAKLQTDADAERLWAKHPEYHSLFHEGAFFFYVPQTEAAGGLRVSDRMHADIEKFLGERCGKENVWVARQIPNADLYEKHHANFVQSALSQMIDGKEAIWTRFEDRRGGREFGKQILCVPFVVKESSGCLVDVNTYRNSFRTAIREIFTEKKDILEEEMREITGCSAELYTAEEADKTEEARLLLMKRLDPKAARKEIRSRLDEGYVLHI